MHRLAFVLLYTYSCIQPDPAAVGEGDGTTSPHASEGAKASSIPTSASADIPTDDQPAKLAAPTNFIDGSSQHYTDKSPQLEWDSVISAVSYEISIGSTIGGTDILAWTDVGNVNIFQATGLSLALGTYYASIRAVGSNNEKGQTVTADGWTVTACPSGYIEVPGNTTAGLGGEVYSQGTKSSYDWSSGTETIRSTGDFCVMKYEAKDGGSHTAVSVPSGTPWLGLQREKSGADNDAQEACENNGAGYHLIGNHHWQAIARNIESTPSNYNTNGQLSDHAFNRGYTDAGIWPIAADADDANGCAGVTINGLDASTEDDDCDGVWHTNKRTHTLSNGEVIWDLVGNREWVRDNHSSWQGSNGAVQEAPYVDVLKWGPANDYSLQTGAQKAGLGSYVVSDMDDWHRQNGDGAILRGGVSGWVSDVGGAGIFSADLSDGPNGPLGSLIASVGFRCVFAP